MQVPGAGCFDLLLEFGLVGAQLVVVGVDVGPSGQHLLVAGEEVGHRAHAVHDVSLHVLGRVQRRLLLEQPYGEAVGQAGLAGEAVVDAGHDPQQR